MADQTMTVRRFLFEGRASPEALDADVELDELQEELAKELGGKAWSAVRRQIVEQIGAVLDFGMVESVLAPAWSRLEQLQEYRDPELHPPEETSAVPLVAHTVSSTHRPHIELVAGQVEIGRLTLDVELELEVEGVVLGIRGGRIRTVGAGAATARGKLACAYKDTPVYALERESERFELDTGVDLGDGVEIPDLEKLERLTS